MFRNVLLLAILAVIAVSVYGETREEINKRSIQALIAKYSGPENKDLRGISFCQHDDDCDESSECVVAVCVSRDIVQGFQTVWPIVKPIINAILSAIVSAIASGSG